jgi:chromosome segregation protein
MLKDFVQGSQFIVVTHNRQTIAAAHVLYGITMDGGVSNIMSVKFSDHVKEEVRTDTVAGHKREAAPA